MFLNINIKLKRSNETKKSLKVINSGAIIAMLTVFLLVVCSNHVCVLQCS